MSIIDFDGVTTIYQTCRNKHLDNVHIKSILDVWFEAKIALIKKFMYEDNKLMLTRFICYLFQELIIRKQLLHDSCQELENRLLNLEYDIRYQSISSSMQPIINAEVRYYIYKRIFEYMIMKLIMNIPIDKQLITKNITTEVLNLTRFDDKKSDVELLINYYF